MTLKVLQEEVSKCTKCSLHKTRTNTVFGEGDPNADVVFCGEAPGATEDETGRPFVGRAGKLLTNMIKSIGLEREEVFILNICKCRPPNNRKPTSDEMDSCSPFLIRQLELIKPKCIVALGATAVEGLLGPGLGITKRRGSWERYTDIPVMPTYHPSFLLRQPKRKDEAWEDFQAVKKLLEE